MYTNNNKKSRSNSEYWTKKNKLAKKAKLHTEKMKEKYCKEIAEAKERMLMEMKMFRFCLVILIIL